MMRLRKPCEHGLYDPHDYLIDDFGHTRICPGGEFLPEDAELIERIAKAVGEMFLYPDPNREGNWMGPGIEASRQVARAAFAVLTDQVGEIR